MKSISFCLTSSLLKEKAGNSHQLARLLCENCPWKTLLVRSALLDMGATLWMILKLMDKSWDLNHGESLEDVKCSLSEGRNSLCRTICGSLITALCIPCAHTHTSWSAVSVKIILLWVFHNQFRSSFHLYHQEDSEKAVLKGISWFINSNPHHTTESLSLVYPHSHIQDIFYKLNFILKASKCMFITFYSFDTTSKAR